MQGWIGKRFERALNGPAVTQDGLDVVSACLPAAALAFLSAVVCGLLWMWKLFAKK
jgi:hypothetical protein